jgi:hypothetical protein
MLPVEIIDQIVHLVRQQELLVLCRVSKQVQIVAESRLYESMQLRDPTRTFLACSALTAQDFVRASYVRRFWMWQDTRLCVRGPLPEPLWQLVQAALVHMENLEDLYLYDDTYSNTWIFENPVPFKLRESWLFFQWDQKLVSFLGTQDRLKFLSLHTGDEDNSNSDLAQRISLTGNFPDLETLECPLHVAFDLLSSNLKRLSFVLDDDHAPLFESFVEAMAVSSMTLSSLYVIAVPEFLMADTLYLLGASSLSTTLRHLGVLSLPLMDVCRNAIQNDVG